MRHHHGLRVIASLAILGVFLVAGQPGQAATAPSDWPSLNADASQSNFNGTETGITASNVLKLKVKWVASLPDLSYPVVAGGRVYAPVLAGSTVHARALDAATGKQIALFRKGAIGGLLATNGSLYIAGHSLVQIDPSSGDKQGETKGTSTSKHATFTFPLADSKLIVTGYASDSRSIPNTLYGIDPDSGQVVWKLPSSNAQGALARGRVITLSSAGSVFYNENNGQLLASKKSLFSDWFGGSTLIYTVASVAKKGATAYAFNTSGKKVWARTVGPVINALGWAHAVDGNAVYLATMTPQRGVEALDPVTGDVVWKRSIPDVQRLAVANNLLFILTAGIGQPLKLNVLHADTGKAIGAIKFSTGYYAFPTSNELMIADGMIFIRAVGPGGATQLVALGK